MTTRSEKTVFKSFMRSLRPSQETRTLTALEGVSFEVHRHEVFGIIGPNGAGKTTLLMILAGLLQPTSGEVIVSRGMSSPYLKLSSALHGELNVEDNIRLCGALLGIPKKVLNSRLDEIIRFGELEPYRYAKLAELSGGFQARVAFSTALHNDESEAILLDETMEVGDYHFKQKCRQTFQRLIDQGKTVVLVSHSMEDVKRLCKRCLYLSGGRVRALGPPENVVRQFISENTL